MGGFFDWFRRKADVPAEPAQTASLVSRVPLELAVEKLKGFVAEQEAEILGLKGNQLSIKLNCSSRNFDRRSAARPVPFHVLLEFLTFVVEQSKQKSTGTRSRVVVTPMRRRDRRKVDLREHADLVIDSLKSYLMASSEESTKNKTGLIERAAT